MNAENIDQQQCCTATERVGVLAVHGMGEQGENAHRDALANVLVRSWRAQYGYSNVLDVTSSYQPASPDCPKKPDRPNPPIVIRINVSSEPDRTVEVEIREVYWADLDEAPEGFVARAKRAFLFWVWGLSVWARQRKKFDRDDSLAEHGMIAPDSGPMHWTRLKLFLVGIWFSALGLTWELLRVIAKWLRIAAPGSGVLVRHLGDVELYTDNAYRFRPEKASASDRPRDAIRRRMITALTVMAGEGYDRWYLVAHSQGSVIAHNGLMELDVALPKYLTKKEWQDLHNDLKGTGNPIDHKEYLARPCWLQPNDAIDRQKLFNKLRGFITYGSPLDKFATIWPAIVPINTAAGVLDKCEWRNVHDRMDPVAGKLDYFCKKNFKFRPINVAYQSSFLFVVAHISYLKWHEKGGFPQALACWIATDKIFKQSTLNRRGGGGVRAAVRIAWWPVIGFIPLCILGYAFDDWLMKKALHVKAHFPETVVVFVALSAFVLIVGVWNRVRSNR